MFWCWGGLYRDCCSGEGKKKMSYKLPFSPPRLEGTKITKKAIREGTEELFHHEVREEHEEEREQREQEWVKRFNARDAKDAKEEIDKEETREIGYVDGGKMAGTARPTG